MIVSRIDFIIFAFINLFKRKRIIISLFNLKYRFRPIYQKKWEVFSNLNLRRQATKLPSSYFLM